MVSSQPIRIIEQALRILATPEAYVFSVADLGALVPEISQTALRMVLSRAVQHGILVRACRGMYLWSGVPHKKGYELFHIAAKLRAGYFNYISQETVLGDLGIISQVPLQHITIMSSGSSGIVRCGALGSIEFTHTKKVSGTLMELLSYDPACRMLRANAALAYADLEAARRNLHLVDKDVLDEYLV
jgi:hypothetical protein